MSTTDRPALPASPARRLGRRTARLGLMLATAAVAIVVAACSSAAGAPGFTYAPPASSTATMPGMDTSPSPSGPAVSDGPPASASAAPVAGGSPAPTGATLHISAQNIAFDTNHLEATAGQAFVLEFDNNDAGVPHNVEIKDNGGVSVFKGQIITGPAKASYQVPALPAGSYMFLCDVHPFMTGTLTVQ